MPTIAGLASFSDGTTAIAAPVNANFAEIKNTVNAFGMFTDVARTVTAVQTFSVAPVCSAGLTVSASGITVTGNSTITGTLGGVSTLTCTTVTATNLGGTLSTAAQPNVTSLGTLTSLSVSGVPAFSALDLTRGSGTDYALFFNPSAGNSQVHIKNSTILTIDNAAETLNMASFDVANGRVKFGITSSVDTKIGDVIATDANTGFAFIPFCSGAATGSPTLGAGALVLDISNNRLYCYTGSAWKYASLT
jgi:hypothetical protein